MKAKHIVLRWMPTFLAFPLAGLVVTLALGPITDSLAAAVAGAMVGSFLGLSQWWALKPWGVSFDWAWSTAVGLMIASPIAWTLIDYSTSVAALTLWGALTGCVVGLAQLLSQRAGLVKTLLWSAITSFAWALAWFISATVIVDADSHYAIFGSTGALFTTAALALFVNSLAIGKSR